MSGRRWLILAVAGLVTLAVVLTMVARQIRPRVHSEIVKGLSAHLDSAVTLDELTLELFPQFTVSGRGLTIRHQGRTDIPPLVVVGQFTGRTSWTAALRRHVSHVMVEGLEITIPPRRRQDMPSLSGGDTSDDTSGLKPAFAVERLAATNARLTITPKRADKDPRVFDIFSLDIHNLNFVTSSRFDAVLTNPIPFGRIETTGTFGPWVKEEPSATPVAGDYTFNADLGTIKGIAGALQAEGRFDGAVDRIATQGQTHTADFRIPKLKAQSLPLSTTFDAVVDGTNGDVVLNQVGATLSKSHFVARGSIVGTKGIKGKRAVLNVTSQDALMEELLALTVRGTPAAMKGVVSLDTAFDLPQGEADVVDKLQLDGSVRIKSARFTSDNVQDKIDELSRRGRGRPKDASIDNVVSNLATSFTLKQAVVTLRGLTYTVPGAQISLDGTYALESSVLDFAGVARLDASVSDTQTGFRHFLLMPFDALFRKGDAGTRLAIKVGGTADQPKFGLDIGKTVKRK